MKALAAVSVFLAIVFAVFFSSSVSSQTSESADKTLSPYFFVRSDDPETDALPLKSTAAGRPDGASPYAKEYSVMRGFALPERLVPMRTSVNDPAELCYN